MNKIFCKHKLGRMVWPVLSVCLASAFLPIFLYCQNADEAAFGEILPAVFLFIGTGVIVFLLFALLTRSVEKAAIIAVFFILVFAHFSFLEQGMKIILPKLKYWHTAPIIIILCLHIAYGINRFVKEEWAADIVKVLNLVLGGLVIFNITTNMPQIINHVQAQLELRNSDAQEEWAQTEVVSDMPNVYLLIFDECANFIQMKEYYDYDNVILKDFLEKNHFEISYSSHNESDQTTTVLTNLANLNYIVDDKVSSSDKEVMRKDGLLFDVFRQRGYQVQILESGGFFGGKLPGDYDGGRSNAVTIEGKSLGDLLVERSIAYPLWDRLTDTDKLIEETITIVADYLSNEDNLPQSGVFTLAYFNCPHQPFLVDEYGNMVPANEWQNWDDQKYYLGQYKYTTKKILQILENLVSNDPESIIIVQSDHGARRGPVDKWPTRDIKTNILNTVYYQGKNIDIDGLSGINTIRTILNNLFDMDYEMIPLPEWRYK